MKKEKYTPTDEERKAFSIVGSFGGRATVRKNGKKHMSRIGKAGALKRWGKK